MKLVSRLSQEYRKTSENRNCNLGTGWIAIVVALHAVAPPPGEPDWRGYMVGAAFFGGAAEFTKALAAIEPSAQDMGYKRGKTIVNFVTKSVQFNNPINLGGGKQGKYPIGDEYKQAVAFEMLHSPVVVNDMSHVLQNTH